MKRSFLKEEKLRKEKSWNNYFPYQTVPESGRLNRNRKEKSRYFK